jgi:hypothetical protein
LVGFVLWFISCWMHWNQTQKPSKGSCLH